MQLTGAFRERLARPGSRSGRTSAARSLQALGVMLGVASVLGGFSISDSQRSASDELFVKMGGLDKLNVQPAAAMRDGSADRPPDGEPRPAQRRRRRRARSSTRRRSRRRRPASSPGRGCARPTPTRSAHPRHRRRLPGDRRLRDRPGPGLHRRRTSTPPRRSPSWAPRPRRSSSRTGTPSARPCGRRHPGHGRRRPQERVFRFGRAGRNMFWWRNRIIAASRHARRRAGCRATATARVDRVTFRIPTSTRWRPSRRGSPRS